jgi:hypothetical protein
MRYYKVRKARKHSRRSLSPYWMLYIKSREAFTMMTPGREKEELVAVHQRASAGFIITGGKLCLSISATVKKLANKGSSGGLVHYLEKENRLR